MVLFKKQNELIWLDELDVSLVSAEPIDGDEQYRITVTLSKGSELVSDVLDYLDAAMLLREIAAAKKHRIGQEPYFDIINEQIDELLVPLDQKTKNSDGLDV